MESECRYYNWDDLEVGRFDLNHSEKFFTRKHKKHERIDGDSLDSPFEMEERNRENRSKPTRHKENQSPVKAKYVSPAVRSHKPGSNSKSSKDTKSVPSNILRQPLLSRNQLQAAAAATQPVPSVVKYKDIYEKKRQLMVQRTLEEEKKKRIFKSKPAPKFSSEPKPRKPADTSGPKITTPITPMVMKHSKEMEEKRRRRIEEYQKRNEPPKFVSREPHVLYEEPFKPQRLEQCIEPEPFNLHVEKRLEERKQYDKQIKEKTEEKKRQEEYERQKHEERLVREIRKMTTFKARPNPFK
ncbi:unnamed protein product [Hermetia illucens]|uniref:TPX2 C-terminal domain-containing protein n=1 Tax=Hermetia illucens TaxID=343691 RepID=A0A7R8V3U4_HERIL|nr:targeting protein for Xklp2 homolog isoform X2 [Hermetia illucens]CAD7091165.1 unnamed protein product [Hermetia illucens]